MKNSPSKNCAGKGVIQSGDPHGYLGHFRNANVVKRGHNQGFPGAARAKSRAVSGISGDTATVQRQGAGGKSLAKSVGLSDLGRVTARRAIKAGGDIGAAVAAAKPKLAARIARRTERRSRIAGM